LSKKASLSSYLNDISLFFDDKRQRQALESLFAINRLEIKNALKLSLSALLY